MFCSFFQIIDIIESKKESFNSLRLILHTKFTAWTDSKRKAWKGYESGISLYFVKLYRESQPSL